MTPLTVAVSHQLRRASQATSAAWQQHSPEVTLPQYAVLRVLGDNGELDQSAIGARTCIDRSTLTPLLDRLESRGLITKTIDPANRRRRLIALTDTGRADLAKLRGHAAAVEQWIQQVLGDRQARQLATLLRTLGDAPPPGRPVLRERGRHDE